MSSLTVTSHKWSRNYQPY